MPYRGPARLPVLCRILIGAAAWLVPREMRAEWQRKWRDGAGHWWAFLNEREEFLVRDGYRQLVRHCATAFADAAWLRFRRERIRDLVRGPAFVLLAALAVLAATAIGSGGFRMLRSIWAPLPYPNPTRLVTVTAPGVIGPFGVPAVHVGWWGERARTLTGIAGYRELRFRRGIATANLFTLVGVRPALGRVFSPGDRAGVLLSYEHWCDAYRRDPSAVGSTVMLDGEPQQVIGVLPPSAQMPGLPDLPLWTLADVYDLQSSRLFGAIARLAPGVSTEQAARELIRLAGKVKPRMIYDVRVWPLRAPIQGRTLVWIAFPGFGLVVGVVLVAVGKQSPVAGHVAWRRRLRCWAFLILKTALVLAALTLFWIEAVTARTIRAPESDLREFVNLMAALVPTFGFLAVCALATLWCVVDQRKRCPVCLARLAMPVTLGSWSSSLLDPVTTEFVCERGHGSLAMHETDASSTEPDRWTAMDDSWRDLFTRT
jgi:hypothetical protein